MTHRVTALLDESAWALLKAAPQSDGSSVVNRALAAREMDRLRASAAPVSEREVLELLRADRERVT